MDLYTPRRTRCAAGTLARHRLSIGGDVPGILKHERETMSLPWKNRDKHPSHGVVRIGRVSANPGVRLFRSSLTHHHFITLTVCRAHMSDHDGYDFVHADEELIEVSMSESQFARMITSMNMGSGSPVTISRFQGELVESPPVDDRKAFVAKGHGNSHVKKNESLAAAIGTLNEMRENGKRPTLKEMDEIIGLLHSATVTDRGESFYRERFAEEMEHIVDEAKTEVEAHIIQSVKLAGIEGLQDKLPRLE